MTLALNNPVRRLVAHSDKIAITSGNRMSLTGYSGLGYSERHKVKRGTLRRLNYGQVAIMHLVVTAPTM